MRQAFGGSVFLYLHTFLDGAMRWEERGIDALHNGVATQMGEHRMRATREARQANILTSIYWSHIYFL